MNIGLDDLFLDTLILGAVRLLVHVALFAIAVGEAIAVERGAVGGSEALGNPGVAVSDLKVGI